MMFDLIKIKKYVIFKLKKNKKLFFQNLSNEEHHCQNETYLTLKAPNSS
jgi:hypothetical protein